MKTIKCLVKGIACRTCKAKNRGTIVWPKISGQGNITYPQNCPTCKSPYYDKEYKLKWIANADKEYKLK